MGKTSVTTVKTLYDYYLNNHIAALKSAKSYESIGKTVLSHWGEKRPQDIGPAEAKAYISLRGRQGVSPWTIRKELVMLGSICRYAAKHRLMPAADIPVLEYPPVPRAKNRWLSEEELVQLMVTARNMRKGSRISRVERFLWLAVMTAARKNAIETLLWEDVDFETGVVAFDARTEGTKNKRRASVPMNDELRIILEQAHKERGRHQYVLDHSTNIRHPLDAVIKESGLENVTAHVLRHTAATHMARRGVPLWIIAGVLGNSVAMVERVYAHHNPEHAREAVAELPSLGAVNQTQEEKINEWLAE